MAALVAGVVPVSTAGSASAAEPRPRPLPLERHFDNRAVSDDSAPGSADFDGSGASLSAQDLAAAGWTPGRALTVDASRIAMPDTRPGRPDNVRADGQSVRVSGRGDALSFLVAGTGGDAVGTGTVHYSDGSRGTFRLAAPDWRTGPLATKSVALPHVNTPDGRLDEKARLYVVTVPIAEGRRVASVRLPEDPGAADLHVFDVSVRTPDRGLTGSWSTSTSGYTEVGPWTDRTLRLVVHTSTGGPAVRIRLDNTFAGTPVRIGGATVAVQGDGAEARSAPVRLRFGGERGTEIPAGAQAFSDPVGFDVPADANLLVSFHLPDTVTAAPVHSATSQTSYLSEPGDHAAEGAGSAYTSTIGTWPFLTGVDVGGGPGSLVMLGDSITDGVGSTQDANLRWPDVLARRILTQDDIPHYGVLNQGISANRVVQDRYPGDGVSTDTGGVSALHRFDRDVAAQTTARTVVVFEGVNDIRWGDTAAQVIHGLREIAERAEARGLRSVAATIAPCEGEERCTAAVDAERRAINDWIRSSGAYDAVLDFDAVLRDPAHPARILPAYDSGDHLHPGDGGLKAIADSVDLRELVG
ncbi:SGNH/GDSL hydrolase family protein [Streptomyces triticagri]|uniref:SGNH/GDSL hydrolase family protein n=1 Tax=Streptomyces triticagri TaxID=2293568 RepID=A0A372M6H7_9ACTN|nr:SGNH/GDSL hydrolase family protein [Streptomyces triticagri]RFU86544.1 SGNH/GDSL hydrolase family protein [Streptomyces triticagri]